jgi:hypothetical protein
LLFDFFSGFSVGYSRKMEDNHLQNLDKLLKAWSSNICESTKEIIVGALGRYPENMTTTSQDIMEDIRDRQSRVISVRCPVFLVVLFSDLFIFR